MTTFLINSSTSNFIYLDDSFLVSTKILTETYLFESYETYNLYIPTTFTTIQASYKALNTLVPNTSFLIVLSYFLALNQTTRIKDRLFRILILFEILILSVILFMIFSVTSITLYIGIINALMLIALAACETAIGLSILITQLKYIQSEDIK